MKNKLINSDRPFDPISNFFKWGSTLMVACVLGTQPAQCDQLEELLNQLSQPQMPPAPSAETRALWERFLTAAEQGDMTNTRSLAVSFANLKATTEAYQKDFTDRILGTFAIKEETSLPDTVRNQLAELAVNQQEQQAVQATVNDLQTKRKQLKDEMPKTEKTTRLVGLAGSIFGSISGVPVNNNGNAISQEVLQNKKATLAKTEDDLHEADTKLANLKGQISQLQRSIETAKRRHVEEFRDGVVQRMDSLDSDGYTRVALALGDNYIRILGGNEQVSAARERASKNVKLAEQARQIAAIIAKDAGYALDAQRPWKAVSAINEAALRIEDKIANNRTLALLVARELGNLKRRADAMALGFLQERDAIFDRIKTNPQARDEFEKWALNHPEYPNLEKDRTQVIVEAYNADLEVIKTLAQDRPLEAFDKIQEFLKKLDARTKTIMEAKVCAITDGVFEQAVVNFRQRVEKILTLKLEDKMKGPEKAIRLKKAADEYEAIRLELQAWKEKPMPDLAKARFQGIENELPSRFVTKLASIVGNFTDIVISITILAGLLGGAWWLRFLLRRRPATSGNRKL